MSLSVLTLIALVALLGPALSAATAWRVPLVLGELIAGILIGTSGFQLVSASDPTFTFLADIGFALTMFVAGSHVPVRDSRLRPALWGGIAKAVAVGVLAAIAGMLIAEIFHTGHSALYAVLMASSSAALVLPAFDNLGIGGPLVLPVLAQVAVADTASIVALPLVIDPANAPRAALGSAIIAAAAVVLFFVLRWFHAGNRWHRLRKVSEQRNLALELRVSLILLFGFGAVAVWMHVSIMLAGFAAGLAVAGVGEPRRLARQLFAIGDGFLGPLFFVWLGASLSLSGLASDPQLILLGVLLGIGAIAVHMAMRVFGQPLLLGTTAASQLGVPVAAATIGSQTGELTAGEPAALILGALVTIAGLTIAAGLAARSGRFRTDAGSASAGRAGA